MTKPMTEQSPSTKLLTLINVNQIRPTKRKRINSRDWYKISKLVENFDDDKQVNNNIHSLQGETLNDLIEKEEEEEEGNHDSGIPTDVTPVANDSFERHWGSNSITLGDNNVEEVEPRHWKSTNFTIPGLGNFSQLNVQGKELVNDEIKMNDIYNARLALKYETKISKTVLVQQKSFLKLLASYRDVFYPKINPDNHEDIRATSAFHAMNHVLKTRSRVLKNNERLAKLATLDTVSAFSSARSIQDQGFTRPKVLILLPFRNAALIWVDLLTTISLADSIENKSRFDSEFSLPEGAIDKLVQNPELYSADHVRTFSGNIDDSFRLGLKVTRKSIKLFSEFYSSDVIIASPLGLRQSIEKDKDSDFLSSIEILIIDQMDSMLMQNWDHVQFVLDRMNKLPTEAHGCDFSRVKPWYLNGKSIALRQSILLSQYETPELRALYSKTLQNVGGKIKAEVFYDGIMMDVPKGIKQVFTRFESLDAYSENDARFEHFTTQTLPMLIRSAVSSSQTVIFIPSYFDFVRVKRYMKKLDDFSFTSISEYTPTPDVSRARGAFFSGKKSFLLITERFHFFRRYRIRGAKTFIFYALPEHSHYYPEVLNFPFPKLGADEPQVDESQLSCQVLYSRFDILKLERLCGTEDANKMIASDAKPARFTFLE